MLSNLYRISAPALGTFLWHYRVVTTIQNRAEESFITCSAQNHPGAQTQRAGQAMTSTQRSPSVQIKSENKERVVRREARERVEV